MNMNILPIVQWELDERKYLLYIDKTVGCYHDHINPETFIKTQSEIPS